MPIAGRIGSFGAAPLGREDIGRGVWVSRRLPEDEFEER
jgi:hypothetical protein